MSEWHPRIVTIGEIHPHPNADRLELTYVDDYPVVVGIDTFHTGDKAVYLPIDTILPEAEVWDNVRQYTSKGRIKAAKLRGVLSLGMLHKMSEVEWNTFYDFSSRLFSQIYDEGTDGATEERAIIEFFGLTKYEPPIRNSGYNLRGSSGALPDIPAFPKYTDLEALRKYPNVLNEGEWVYVTEKLHGSNGRWGWIGGEFLVGSRNQRLDADGDSIWARVARQLNLQEILSEYPEMVFYGEVLGVQDLMYGLEPGNLDVVFFDILDTRSLIPGIVHRADSPTFKFKDNYALHNFEIFTKLKVAKVLYEGPFFADTVKSFAEGRSTYANHVREGVVIRPNMERFHPEIGRCILKHIGSDYLLRKGG